MTRSDENQIRELGGAAEAALAYTQLGWEPLVLPFKEKTPRGKWKEPRAWTPDTIKGEFGDNANVGIALGKRSNGLIDIDFDCPEAAELAKVILGDLPRPPANRLERSSRSPIQTLVLVAANSGSEPNLYLGNSRFARSQHRFFVIGSM